ncbi:MAG: phoA [Anaerolineaceae bacterium]|nr:MAG: phoA [Anaerolineaceae bacterium]
MRSFSCPALLLALLALLLASCIPGPTLSTPEPDPVISASPVSPTFPPSPAPTATPRPLVVRFAVIGDYGWGGAAEADVAALVHGWQPDIVITVGDNNYPSGSASTIDDHIGQYYHDYIFPYSGAYGPGADVNRFFPSPGNHDWVADGAQPYLDYFTLPGNERYYDFVWGPVHFFAIDSDDREPDGVGRSSVQAAWLEAGLAASTSVWNVVYFHHPPYSSGYHGSTDWMRWPFAAWGADAVLSGHDHTYERLLVDGKPVAAIGRGLVILLGIGEGDTEEQARFLAEKTAGLRIFEDSESKFNLSLLDVKGEALVVSQFTLYGDARKGRRPSFSEAARPEVAAPLVEKFCDFLRAQGVPTQTGVFAAHMLVEIANDGPVTIWLEK